MGELSEAAKQARRDYHNDYNAKNREHINELAREWRQRNPEKVREINARYWERKAKKGDDNVTI